MDLRDPYSSYVSMFVGEMKRRSKQGDKKDITLNWRKVSLRKFADGKIDI